MIGKVSRRRPGLLAVSVLVLAIAGCGSSGGGAAAKAKSGSGQSPSTQSGTSVSRANLAATEHPVAAQFPRAGRRSLKELGALATETGQLGAATGVLTPGTSRYGFGLTTTSGTYLYGPTVLYIAAKPSGRAAGPFLAPGDAMDVAPQYRSQQNAGPFGIHAIYETSLRLPRAGTYTILALTRTGGHLIASAGEIAVAPSSPIPDVGQRPPAIATGTLASVGGKVALLTTRLPPESMHSVSFSDVLGKRPIALLFSTPELCLSKVCGPVTDLLVQIQHEFGSRITFIHQEIYVDNQPTKGLRPQLKAFHLQTEPWLFTINRRGIIVARLQGAFGVNALRKAIEAALA